MAKNKLFKSNYLRILFVSILLAVFATVLAQLYMKRYIALATGGEKISVLTPVKNISKGTTITDGMLKVHSVPANYVPENAIRPDYKDYILGQKAAFDIKQGGYIIWTDIAIEEEVNLSQTLLSGERAMTIRVDDVSGVSGLIEPGDSVDILISFDVPGKDYSSTESLTKLLLQDVIVLAVGKQTVPKTYTSDLAGPRGFVQGVAREALSTEAPTITLKLKPEEALILAFAEEKGRLKLILRSRGDVKFERIKDATLKRILEFVPGKLSVKYQALPKKDRYGYPVIYIEGKRVSSSDEEEKKEEKDVDDEERKKQIIDEFKKKLEEKK